MTDLDFRYYVLANDVTARVGKTYARVEKVKVHFHYEGQSLNLLLRFGKGTEQVDENITLLFDLEASHIEVFGVQTIWQNKKPVQRALWECHGTPRIANFDIYKSDRSSAAAKFISVLRLPDIKEIIVLAPIHNKFNWDHWENLKTTYDKQNEYVKSMLTIYPNPSKMHALPAISECTTQKARNSFSNFEVWSTVMTSCLLREASVYQNREDQSNIEECWAIFDKDDKGISCNVYAQSVAPGIPHIINPIVGQKVNIRLRDNGYRKLSNLGSLTSGYAIITEIGKQSDFIVRFTEYPNNWTEQDMNFEHMSTIRLERIREYRATDRHLAAVKECYYTKSNSFPLRSLILLNREIPRVVSLNPQNLKLNYIQSLLNPTQGRAFQLCILPETPAVLIQGPPGTGKSFTLALIAVAYALILNIRCLIVTPTNYAADEITEKITGLWDGRNSPPCKGPPPNVLRWLTPANEHLIFNATKPRGVSNAMSAISMAGTLHRRIRSAANGQGSIAEQNEAREWLMLWEHRKKLEEADSKRLHQLTSTWEMICQKETDIAITTCDNSYTLNPDYFTAGVIIADESSQTIEPATLLPIVRFIKNLRLVILAGDDEQLRPFVLSTSNENEFEAQLKKSWFERVRFSTVVPTITLGQQYRMRPEISKLVIKYFYNTKLHDDLSVNINRPTYNRYIDLCKNLNKTGPTWAASEWPIYNVVMIDMKKGAKTPSKNDRSDSKYNNGHVIIVRDLLNLLLHPDTGIRGQDIVIITPYLAQRVRHIRALKEASILNRSLEKVIVSTVDKFQGQESDIIILDLVIRTNKNSAYGFMTDRHRLNVAISRARDVLITIGDANKYNLRSTKNPPTQYRKFLEVMTDIANKTIIWDGDNTDLNSMDKWDSIYGTDDTDEYEEESEPREPRQLVFY